MGHFDSCTNPERCSCETKQYLVLAGLSFLAFGIEIFGWYVSKSLALLGDAFHVLADGAQYFVAIVVVFFVRKNALGARKKGAYISGVILLCVAVSIALEGIERFVHPVEINALAMLPAAILGLGINLIQLFILEKYNHGHITHKMLSVHVLSDTFLSVAVILNGFFILAYDIRWTDPLIAIVIGLWICSSTVGALISGDEGHDHHGHHH